MSYRKGSTDSTTDGTAIKLITTCNIAQWSRDPPYNNVDWYENDINNTPSFAVHPKTFGTRNTATDTNPDYLKYYPSLWQDSLTTTAVAHTPINYIYTATGGFPKIKYIYVYYNTTTVAPKVEVSDPSNAIIYSKTLTAAIPDTGPTCCTVVKYILPDNQDVKYWGIIATGLKIFGVRVVPYPALPAAANYITVQSTFNKDPAFFQKYGFTAVSAPQVTLGQYLNADVFPNSYSGRRIYAPHMNTAVYKQGQYWYIINNDNQPEAKVPNVSWGGLGYSNEADAIGPGKWEIIYDLYGYWLNGTLDKFGDQNGNYWYRRLQSLGTAKYP